MVGAMSTKGIYLDNMLEPKSSESDNFKLFFSSKYGDFGSLFFPPQKFISRSHKSFAAKWHKFEHKETLIVPWKTDFPQVSGKLFLQNSQN